MLSQHEIYKSYTGHGLQLESQASLDSLFNKRTCTPPLFKTLAVVSNPQVVSVPISHKR